MVRQMKFRFLWTSCERWQQLLYRCFKTLIFCLQRYNSSGTSNFVFILFQILCLQIGGAAYLWMRLIHRHLQYSKLIYTVCYHININSAFQLQDIATYLQVPLLEILKFPYFLHHEQLADLFTQGLIALNVCGCPLKLEELEEKLPGTYLLLVHHDPEVQVSVYVQHKMYASL